MQNWLEIEHLSKTFYQKKNWLKKTPIAGGLHDLSFTLSEGSVGILGESGSGKTTLVKLIAGIEQPDKGTSPIRLLIEEPLARKQSPVSLIFQDYTTAINPEFTLEEALMEPLAPVKHREKALYKIKQILKKVDLPETYLTKKTAHLSGGQIQRVCIARSLLSDAKILIFDEAFSSLDLLTTDHLLDLLFQLKDDFQLNYIFVTHNLEIATYFCDRLVFLREGRLEETITTEQLMTSTSPYVQALIAAQL